MEFDKNDCMTVKEMKHFLNDLGEEHEDDIIVLASTSEGMEYSPLLKGMCNVDSTFIPYKNSPWTGDLKIRKLTEELMELGFSEEDLAEEGEENYNCIVLYPNY